MTTRKDVSVLLFSKDEIRDGAACARTQCDTKQNFARTTVNQITTHTHRSHLQRLKTPQLIPGPKIILVRKRLEQCVWVKNGDKGNSVKPLICHNFKQNTYKVLIHHIFSTEQIVCPCFSPCRFPSGSY